VSTFLRMEEEAAKIEKLGRECPVPKPGGIVGELLGFKPRRNEQVEGRNGAPCSGISGRGNEN
jgi:cytochrome c oxidase assembly factor 2